MWFSKIILQCVFGCKIKITGNKNQTVLFALEAAAKPIKKIIKKKMPLIQSQTFEAGNVNKLSRLSQHYSSVNRCSLRLQCGDATFVDTHDRDKTKGSDITWRAGWFRTQNCLKEDRRFTNEKLPVGSADGPPVCYRLLTSTSRVSGLHDAVQQSATSC